METATKSKTPRQIIQGFMKKYNLETGGCEPFATPKKWRDRGELYGLTSKLIVVHDGGDLSAILGGDGGFAMKNELDELLRFHGYFMEQCTSWYSAVYEG